MEEQRTKARDARKTTNYMGADATVYDSIDASVTTEFVGYDHLSFSSRVTVLTSEEEITEALSDGEKEPSLWKRLLSMPPWAARKAIQV